MPVLVAPFLGVRELLDVVRRDIQSPQYLRRSREIRICVVGTLSEGVGFNRVLFGRVLERTQPLQSASLIRIDLNRSTQVLLCRVQKIVDFLWILCHAAYDRPEREG